MGKTIKANEYAKRRAQAIREYRHYVRLSKTHADDDYRKTWSEKAIALKKEYSL